MKNILLLLVLLGSGAIAQHKLVLKSGDTLSNIYVTEYNKNIVRYVQAAGKKEMQAFKVQEIILPYNTINYNRGLCCGEWFVNTQNIVEDTKYNNMSKIDSVYYKERKKYEFAGDALAMAGETMLTGILISIGSAFVATAIGNNYNTSIKEYTAVINKYNADLALHNMYPKSKPEPTYPTQKMPKYPSRAINVCIGISVTGLITFVIGTGQLIHAGKLLKRRELELIKLTK
jgi:hypothetical protein